MTNNKQFFLYKLLLDELVEKDKSANTEEIASPNEFLYISRNLLL